MDVIGLTELYSTDFNMKNLMAINKEVERDNVFSVFDDERTTSIFVYLKDCNIKYIFQNGDEIFVPKGSIVYVPHCAKYYVNYQPCSCENALAQLVAFELYDTSGKRFVLSDKITVVCNEKSNFFSEYFDKAVELSDTHPFSYSEFKGLLYSVITDISKQHIKNNMYSKDFYVISPAVDYLKNHEDENISVSELAKLSHISESHFRRVFKNCFGAAPTEYICNQRINKAKKLLQSNTYSVYEISQMLGYDDPSYFSKVFKKQTGISPGKYKMYFRI